MLDLQIYVVHEGLKCFNIILDCCYIPVENNTNHNKHNVSAGLKGHQNGQAGLFGFLYGSTRVRSCQGWET